MKVLYDTSVLVAAFIKTHPLHEKSFSWFKKAYSSEFQSYVSSHTLLEIYAVLTSLPLEKKLESYIAISIIKKNIYPVFTIINYSERDYKNLLLCLSELKIKGGSSYDGLIVFAAYKEKINNIITLNKKDFEKITDYFNITLITL
jgi:predicted nucleic acid-binding protein